MRRVGLWVLVLTVPLLTAARKPQLRDEPRRGGKARIERLQGWKGTAQEVARDMIERYGAPDERTSSMLIWYDNGPWAHTIVTKEGTPHDFPAVHEDVLEQAVSIEIPASKVDELASLHGGLMVDRTRGLLIARCGSEAMNVLALNLARDVARGKRSTSDAREIFTANTVALLEGRSTPLTERLMFEPSEDAADKGRPTVPRRLREGFKRGGAKKQ